MTFTIRLTPEAKQDIRDIARYILKNDSRDRSQYVVREINAKIRTLENFPERGGRPTELILMNDDRDHRETLFGPYRIIYRIKIDAERGVVTVVAVADGRRDMLAFLTERLG